MMTLTLKKILHPVSVLSWDFRLNCCILNIGTVTVYLVAAKNFNFRDSKTNLRELISNIEG